MNITKIIQKISDILILPLISKRVVEKLSPKVNIKVVYSGDDPFKDFAEKVNQDVELLKRHKIKKGQND